MKSIKILLLSLLITIILTSFVSASQVVLNPVNETSNRIFFDETAQYTLTIKNTDVVDHIYTWNTNPVEWIIDSVTSEMIPAGSEDTLDLKIRPRPTNYRGQGFYVLPITVSTTDEKIVKSATIYIKSLKDRLFSYTPSVALGASFKEVIDPRDPFILQLQIRNRNMLDIENLSLSINGGSFEKETKFLLAGLEEKTLEYRFDLNHLLSPNTYPLNINLIYQNKTISSVDKFYDVKPYSSITRDSHSTSKFFKKITISTITNAGNVPKKVTTDISVKWYKSLFTSFSVEANSADFVKKGRWDLTINPDEVVTITIKENYLALPILGVLLLFLILGYFHFRSPLVLKKQSIITGQDEEGISSMKIRIFVKNRTKNPFYNVRLLDRAPSIAKVHVAKGLGILEPSKVVHTEKKGTIIKWDFESLEAYEERIVTYEINARLKIIGHLGLPSVKVKFENVKGRHRTTESGRAIIGAK